MIRTIFRKALLAIALTPLLTALFLGLVLVAFAAPNAPIKKHLLERTDVLTARRADNGRVIDADTECIGMSVGLYQSSSTPPTFLKRAINAESVFGCEPFLAWLDTGDEQTTRDYFRYWHGYLALSRPLLSVMAYNDLRGLMFTGSLLLLAWLAIALGRDFGMATGVAIALPFLVLNAMGVMVVATKAVSFMLLCAGALSVRKLKTEEPPYLFLFTLGALTAFFDFFTIPFLIFCVVAMVWVIYRSKAGRKTSWTELFFMLAFWGAGWAGFIIIKVLIAEIVLQTDAISDAAGAALFRIHGTSQYVKSFIPGAAVLENFKALKSVWAPVAFLLFIAAPLATKNRRRRIVQAVRYNRAIVALGAAPLLWLEIFSNHSQIHAAFTQLNFAPAFILSGLVLFSSPVLVKSSA